MNGSIENDPIAAEAHFRLKTPEFEKNCVICTIWLNWIEIQAVVDVIVVVVIVVVFVVFVDVVAVVDVVDVVVAVVVVSDDIVDIVDIFIRSKLIIFLIRPLDYSCYEHLICDTSTLVN